MNEATAERKSATVGVENVSVVSPHNLALYEIGKELMVQSLTVGRDYCQFMITTSLSAIPIFISIVAFIIPDGATLDIWAKTGLIIPILLFLASSLVFTGGYLPVAESFSMDILDEIESVRARTIGRRHLLIRVGVALFIASVLIGCFMIIVTMR